MQHSAVRSPISPSSGTGVPPSPPGGRLFGVVQTLLCSASHYLQIGAVPVSHGIPEVAFPRVGKVARQCRMRAKRASALCSASHTPKTSPRLWKKTCKQFWTKRTAHRPASGIAYYRSQVATTKRPVATCGQVAAFFYFSVPNSRAQNCLVYASFRAKSMARS